MNYAEISAAVERAGARWWALDTGSGVEILSDTLEGVGAFWRDVLGLHAGDSFAAGRGRLIRLDDLLEEVTP